MMTKYMTDSHALAADMRGNHECSSLRADGLDADNGGHQTWQRKDKTVQRSEKVHGHACTAIANCPVMCLRRSVTQIPCARHLR